MILRKKPWGPTSCTPRPIRGRDLEVRPAFHFMDPRRVMLSVRMNLGK